MRASRVGGQGQAGHAGLDRVVRPQALHPLANWACNHSGRPTATAVAQSAAPPHRGGCVAAVGLAVHPVHELAAQLVVNLLLDKGLHRQGQE